VTVVVVSPHLDDAVLSCFAALGGSTLVNVFDGVPDASSPLQGWDRMCGFASPVDAALARLQEDDLVFAEHSPSTKRLSLGYVDHPNRDHGPRPTIEGLAGQLVELTAAGDELWAPASTLSPSPHPDHLLVRAAVELMAGAGHSRRIVLYGDSPHCLKQVGEWPWPIGDRDVEPPKAWRSPASSWLATWEPIHRQLAPPMAERKAQAMRGYRSQFRALGQLRDPLSRRVLKRPDVYSIEACWCDPMDADDAHDQEPR
jgi:LmbE family N-acetylglucosaminyl deacetylase